MRKKLVPTKAVPVPAPPRAHEDEVAQRTSAPQVLRLLWQGEMRTLRELAAEAQISISALRGRLWKADGTPNWSLERAMAVPSHESGRHVHERLYLAWGREQTLKEWCAEFDLNVGSVGSRVQREKDEPGFSMEEILKRPWRRVKEWELHGHVMKAAEWARWLNLDGCTLRRRLSTQYPEMPLDRLLRRGGHYWFPTPQKPDEGGHPAVYASVEEIARGAGVDATVLQKTMNRLVREAPKGAPWTPLIREAARVCRSAPPNAA